MAEAGGRWNHNIHYHSTLLGATRSTVQSALDVGCGEGMLTRELALSAATVMGIDTDQASIDAARGQVGARGIEYVVGDFLEYPFEDESFDFITSVATLHHLDATAALTRMRALLRPGGAMAVLGLARSSTAQDLPYEAAGVFAHRVHCLTRRHWEHPSPTVWPPPETYAGMRRLAAELLPGARYRRHVLWRYSIVWFKPARGLSRSVGVGAVEDADDGDPVVLVVDAVDHPVGAPARAVTILQRRAQLLADAVRVVQQGADDEFVRGERDRLGKAFGELSAGGRRDH